MPNQSKHQPDAPGQFTHQMENQMTTEVKKCICTMPFYDESADDSFTVMFTVVTPDYLGLLEALEDERYAVTVLWAAGHRAYNFDRLDLAEVDETSDTPLSDLGLRPGINSVFPLDALMAGPSDVVDLSGIPVPEVLGTVCPATSEVN